MKRIRLFIGIIIFLTSLSLIIVFTTKESGTDGEISRKSPIINKINRVEQKTFGKIVSDTSTQNTGKVSLWDSINEYKWQVGELDMGERVIILSEGDKYYRVQTILGVMGYCEKKFVEVMK